MESPDRLRRDASTIVRILKYLLITALIILSLIFGIKVLILTLPFIIGFILARTAITLSNLIVRASSTGKKRRLLAPWPEKTGLTIFIYFLIVILLFALAVGVIFIAISQIRSLATYLTSYVRDTNLVEQLAESLERLLSQISGGIGLINEDTIQAILNQIQIMLTDFVQRIPSFATDLVNSIGSFVAYMPIAFFWLIVVVMSGYYFLSDSKSVSGFMRRNLPHEAFREKTNNLINTLSNKLFRVVGGYLLLFLITFAITLVGLILIKMPYALVFALIAAVVDILPVLGIGATITPIAIYMFFNGNIVGGVGAIATGLAVMVIRRIIEPPILGNAMQLHPLATLFAMIVGVGLYGLIGLLIGPVFMVVGIEIMKLYGLDVKMRKLIGEMLAKFSEA
ncbi:MAG: AI-2E family transporter [Saccharofermentanales bacterium]|jgi:sporulation integral membrane protein YtvI